MRGRPRGEPGAVAADQGTASAVAAGNRLGLDTSVGLLRDRGFEFDSGLGAERPAMLVAVEADSASTGYFVGLNNFHVITRYNRSVKYALAAVQLSEAIEQRFRETRPADEVVADVR